MVGMIWEGWEVDIIWEVSIMTEGWVSGFYMGRTLWRE